MDYFPSKRSDVIVSSTFLVYMVTLIFSSVLALSPSYLLSWLSCGIPASFSSFLLSFFLIMTFQFPSSNLIFFLWHSFISSLFLLSSLLAVVLWCCSFFPSFPWLLKPSSGIFTIVKFGLHMLIWTLMSESGRVCCFYIKTSLGK